MARIQFFDPILGSRNRATVSIALASALACFTLQASASRELTIESRAEYSGRGWRSVRELTFIHKIGLDPEFRVRVLYFCGAREYAFPGEVNSTTETDIYSYNTTISSSEMEATESTFASLDELHQVFRDKVLAVATQACSAPPRSPLTEDLAGVFVSGTQYFSIKNSRFRSEGHLREFWIETHDYREARRSTKTSSDDAFRNEYAISVYFVHSFASGIARWSVNCDDWTIRVLAAVDYDPKGGVISSFEPGSMAKASSIIPDSAGDFLAKAACKIR